MNPMRASDLDRVLELMRAAFEDLAQALQIFDEDSGRLPQLQRLRGIDHIGRSQAVVQPSRRAALPRRRHAFSHCRGERNYVVLHPIFNLVNAGDIERRVLT